MVLIPIPYALTYTTTVEGQLPKLVACEECGKEFVYLLTMRATGQGTSVLFTDNDGARDQSENQAQALLSSGLHHGCDVVPCPACGHVQDHMLPVARQRYRRWMRTLSIVLFVAGVLLALPMLLNVALDANASGLTPLSGFLLGLVAVSIVGGIGLAYVRSIAVRRYHPNHLPVEERLRVGQSIAVGKEEFLDYLRRQKTGVRPRRY